MIMTTLDKEIAHHEEELKFIREEMRRFRAELVEYRTAVEEARASGDEEATYGAVTKPQVADVKKATSLVNACIETENRLAKCKAERAGIAQCGIAFNLLEARDSIRCKLDSLKDAYCEGSVSG